MKKQPGSKMCFACGQENPVGLHLEFWMDDEHVWTEFTPEPKHQGYPGVLHGGLIATLLDETMGRAATIKKLWMVTGKMELSYRKPVPLDGTLKITAHIQELRGSRMTAIGQILLPDGTVAVEARGLYLRVPDERLQQFLAVLTEQGVDVAEYR